MLLTVRSAFIRFSPQRFHPFVIGNAFGIATGSRTQQFRVVCANRRHVCSASQTLILSNSTFKEIEGILQYRFKDRALLAQAFTHRSLVSRKQEKYLAEYEKEDGSLEKIDDNYERLECLGDRVLGLLTVKALYDARDPMSEGELSLRSQKLVSGTMVTSFSRTLGLHKFLLQEDQLRKQSDDQSKRNGDVLEAVLGALMLDGGYEAAEQFFMNKVYPIWKGTKKKKSFRTPKMHLQEYLVQHGLPGALLGTQLQYVHVKHDKTTKLFTRAIELYGKRLSIGQASTHTGADQEAAKRLLKILESTKTTCLLIRLARQAKDETSLASLQEVRAAQAKMQEGEQACAPVRQDAKTQSV